MRRRTALVLAIGAALSASAVSSRGLAQQPAPQPPAGPAPQPAAPAPPTVVLVPPKLVSDAAVPYPDGATGETSVVLVLTISEDGSVVEAVPTTEQEPFSLAAMRAAMTWRFEPATRNGKPAPSKIKMEVVFRPPEIVPAPEPEPEVAPATTGQPSATPPKKDEGPDEVTVRGERVEPGRSATLSRTEVRQIPGTFGDPFRAVEVMPGVTPIVSGLPFFFIRGAPPGNVGYYLDGVRVPLLFHVGAGPSVVHPALIERVDLYPGGYPARFGRFAGGIVAGETGAPDYQLHGEYNVRLFDAGALAETGLFGNRTTVLVGGRYSYTAALLTQFSPDTTLQYWDYQARATYDLSPDDRIGVFAFGSYDFLGQKLPDGQELTVFGTEFHRVDLRWDHRLGRRGNLRLAATLGLDRSIADQERSTQDRLFGVRAEYTYKLSDKALLRAGSDLQTDAYEVLLSNRPLNPSTARIAGFFASRTDLAFATRADLVLDVMPGFELVPGIRADLFTSNGAAAVGIDPRVATRTTVTPRIKHLVALGLVHQPPAFVIPVPGFQPGGIRGGLQKAWQESTGFEFELGGGTIATTTVYHNAYFDMSDPLGSTPQEVIGCAPGTYPVDTIAGDRAVQPTGTGGGCGVPRFPPGTIGPDRTGGGGQGADSRTSQRTASAFETRSTGSAYGLELLLKRKLTSRLGGFASYTLSRSTRRANGRTYIASFDRTHVANVALAYDLGKNWRAGTRFTFYTGLPKAPDPTTDETRLSPFYRIDLRLEKRWQLGQKAWVSGVAEWMNVTLNKEAVATTCTLQGCDEQTVGPITIPSLGVEGGF